MPEVLWIVLGFAAPAGIATLLQRMSPYRRSKLGLLVRPLSPMPQLEDHKLEIEPLALPNLVKASRPEPSSSAHGYQFIQLDQEEIEGVVSNANFWRRKWHKR